MEDIFNFLSEISKNFPDIIVKKYNRIDTGWMNQIIVVNDELVFRFPRTASAIKKLAMELKLLSVLKQSPVNLPEYKFIHMEYPFFAGYKIIKGDTVENARSLSVNVLNDFIAVLNYMGTFKIDSLKGTLLPLHNASSWIRYEKSLMSSFQASLEENTGTEYFNEIFSLLDIAMSDLNDCDISLIHGDLSRGNVILNRKHSRINGIIDWSDASYGDLALDIAAIIDGFPLRYLPYILQNFSNNFSTRALKRILFYRLVSPLYRAYFLQQTGDEYEAEALCKEILNDRNSPKIKEKIKNKTDNYG